MSDTPRDDERREFSDPTAPSEPVHADDYTAPIETSHTQEVPDLPRAPEAPPQNPYASPPSAPSPESPPQSPYAAPAPGGYGTPPGGYGTPPGGDGTPPGGYEPPAASGYGSPAAGGYGAPPPGYGSAPQGYGAPPPGYGANPYARPANTMSGNTIALLVVSGLLTVGGCGIGIIALVFAIIAATKNDDAAEQAKFTRWGWWALAITFVLAVVAGVLFFVGIAATSTGSSFTGSGY